MKLFIQLMEENKDDPKFWEEYGPIISSEVARLEEIVENFLGFARTKESEMEDVSFELIADNVYKLGRMSSALYHSSNQ